MLAKSFLKDFSYMKMFLVFVCFQKLYLDETEELFCLENKMFSDKKKHSRNNVLLIVETN